MSISREEVRKVAQLARLILDDVQLEHMTQQMGNVLGYMDLLNEADTEGVQPMAHPMDVSDAFREDVARPSLPREEALSNAPNQDGECYRVPAVLGDG